MRTLLLALALAPVFILSACSEEAAEQPQDLPRDTLLVKTASATHVLNVQVAQTDEERSRGLMFVKSMTQAEGMWFVWPESAQRSFWMRNTFIPLDLLFVSNNKVVHIVPWAKPHDESALMSVEPADAVLEVNGGWAAANNVGVGSEVRLESDQPSE